MIKSVLQPLVNKSEYEINGVKYIVSSRFENLQPKQPTINEKFKKIIGSEFAHLTDTDNINTIKNDVCSTAGKE